MKLIILFLCSFLLFAYFAKSANSKSIKDVTRNDAEKLNANVFVSEEELDYFKGK